MGGGEEKRKKNCCSFVHAMKKLCSKIIEKKTENSNKCSIYSAACMNCDNFVKLEEIFVCMCAYASKLDEGERERI